jgi:hydrogenase expression/formation protein HypE
MSVPEPSSACPVPVRQRSRIQLGHGGGGRLTRELVAEIFEPAFANAPLLERHDGATLRLPGTGAPRIALSTDSYVVQPLFFPGGDIGSLAVNGTVNDLAMCGARPLYLSAGFILEEGLPLETLERVAASMARAAADAGVAIVTGDTKVVDKGKADALFVNTAGVGLVIHAGTIGPAAVRPGDRLLLSGDLGRHGVAILAARESLGFESSLESDCAPLAAPALSLVEAGVEVHCLRDLTRGGLAAALCEVAEDARLHLALREESIPVREEVRAACELLGLDPLQVANEGRFVAFVAARDAERALELLRAHPVCAGAVAVGEVAERRVPLVTLRTAFGSTRVVDLPSGEQLPRIC